MDEKWSSPAPVNETLHQVELTPSHTKQSLYPGSPGSPNYPSLTEMLGEEGIDQEVQQIGNSKDVFKELHAFTSMNEEVVEASHKLKLKKAKDMSIADSPDKTEEEKENDRPTTSAVLPTVPPPSGCARRSSGKDKRNNGEKENASIKEFEKALSRRRYHCDEAGAEYTKEGELGAKSDCSFYVHHESQFTPRGTRKSLPDLNRELSKREEHNQMFEKDLEEREKQLTKFQDELSELAESVANQEAKVRKHENELLDSEDMFTQKKMSEQEALHQRRHHNQLKHTALRDLAAEIRHANGEIDEEEERLLHAGQFTLKIVFQRIVFALMYIAIRAVVVCAFLLPWLAPETIQQVGLGGSNASSSLMVKVECLAEASCPVVEEPCPLRIMAPPVLFHAEPDHGWPNLTLGLAGNAQACFHPEDKQTPEFLRWTLAKARKLKLENTDLQRKLKEAIALQDEHTMRLAEEQKHADERTAAQKKLEEQRRAKQQIVAPPKLEEQRRAEQEAAARKSLEEQQRDEVDAASRKRLEEQHRAEEEATSRKRLEEAASFERLEEQRRAEEEAASLERLGEPWKVKSFEAAKVPRAIVVDPPRGASLQWTGLFVAAAAAVREAMFYLQGVC